LTQAQNILVVLPNPMGDAILSGPALRRLRTHFPDSRIVFLGNSTAKAIWEDCPWADEILGYDPADESPSGGGNLTRRLRRERFDSAVLLANSFRSAWMAWQAGIPRRIGYNRDGRGWLLTDRLETLKIGTRYAPISMIDYYGRLMDFAMDAMGGHRTDRYVQGNRRLELFTNLNNKRDAELLGCWDLHGTRRPVILVPGGAYGGSKWWPAPRYAELADRLTERDQCFVVISCAPNETERSIAQEIVSEARHPVYNLTEDRVSLGTLKELIRRSRLMVSNDTGPCHIAAAFGVPLVTLFGPTDPRWTATGYAGEIRLRVNVECGPCQKPVCGKEHQCLEQISVDQVYEAASRLLNTNPSRTEWQKPARLLTGALYHPQEESFVPTGDGLGLVHAGYRELLETSRLGTLEEVFSLNPAEKLDKPGLPKNRERFRIKLEGPGGETLVFYLKRFTRPGTRLGRWLGKASGDSAELDFGNTMRLAEAGISVARPIAFAQDRRPGRPRRSYVILEELPHADALERLLPRWKQAREKYGMLRDRRKLARRLARLVRRLHESGYCHRDLYLSHVFLGFDCRGREYLSLIDLQRVFSPKIWKRRWQVKDLAQLYYSAREYCRMKDAVRFLHEYRQTKKLRGKDKALMRAVYRKSESIAGHDARRKQRLEQTAQGGGSD